jgi:hypothetical protein
MPALTILVAFYGFEVYELGEFGYEFQIFACLALVAGAALGTSEEHKSTARHPYQSPNKCAEIRGKAHARQGRITAL